MAIVLSVPKFTAAPTSGDARPMGDLNTTPLIDVMLCLLVMMILSIPTQTHSVKVDLPIAQPPTTVVKTGHNDLAITADGVILWNATPVTFAQMQHNLVIARDMSPMPELRFQPDAEARYVLVDSVLAAIKRSGTTALGFTGNEQYRRIF